jgi:tetratricopeptide (TPR) repeat protein
MMRVSLFLAMLTAGPRSDAEAGVEAFAQGRYEDAAEILERAYASDPDPALLFAWAQAERYAGHCNEAVPLYRRYLAGKPAADVRGLARDAIAACGEDPDQAAPPPQPPEPDGDPQPEPEPEPEPEVTAAPVRRTAAADPWGHALTWSGLGVASVGAGLLGEAHRRKASGERAPTEQAYRDALAGAPGLSRAGIAMLAGGGALLVAGVVRLAVVAARRRGPNASPAGQARAGRRGLVPAAFGAQGVVWTFELAPRRPRALR